MFELARKRAHLPRAQLHHVFVANHAGLLLLKANIRGVVWQLKRADFESRVHIQLVHDMLTDSVDLNL